MGSIFRTVVVIAILLNVLFWILPYIRQSGLTEEQLNLLRWDTYGAIIESPVWLYWGILTVWIIALVGMYFYVQSARTIFAAYVVLNILLPIWFGYRIFAPLDLVIGNSVALLDGAILVFAYLTSVSEKFRSART